jgi:hypothetical protein
MNTINLFSQNGKQEVIYWERSRFIEPTSVADSDQTSQSTDVIVSEKNKNSVLNIAKPILVEKDRNNILICELIKLMLLEKKPLKIITLLEDVKLKILLYPKDDIPVVILTDSKGSHSDDYLKEIATLYNVENK